MNYRHLQGWRDQVKAIRLQPADDHLRLVAADLLDDLAAYGPCPTCGGKAACRDESAEWATVQVCGHCMSSGRRPNEAARRAAEIRRQVADPMTDLFRSERWLEASLAPVELGLAEPETPWVPRVGNAVERQVMVVRHRGFDREVSGTLADVRGYLKMHGLEEPFEEVEVTDRLAIGDPRDGQVPNPGTWWLLPDPGRNYLPLELGERLRWFVSRTSFWVDYKRPDLAMSALHAAVLAEGRGEPTGGAT